MPFSFFFATVNAAFSSSNSVVLLISRCSSFTLQGVSVSSHQHAFEAGILFQGTGWYFLPLASPTELLVWWTNTSAFTDEDEEGFLIISSSSVYLVNVSPWSLYNGIILRSNYAFFTWLYHRRPWLKGCLMVGSALGRSVLDAFRLRAGCWCAHLLPRHHLLHSLVSLSLQSASLHTWGLWHIQDLIIYWRVTFHLSRWPGARGHRWGPRVTDAIIAHPGTNSHRRCLTLPSQDARSKLRDMMRFQGCLGSLCPFTSAPSSSRVNFLFHLPYHSAPKGNIIAPLTHRVNNVATISSYQD